MAGSTTASSESRWRQFFPIKSIGDVLKLFRHELTKDEPNLALLSVVVGFIEHSLAVGRTTTNTQQVDQLFSVSVDMSMVRRRIRFYFLDVTVNGLIILS